MEPGCALYCCPLQNITPVSVKVEACHARTDTKTHDNVTVSVTTAVHYQVNPEKVQDAFFKLTDKHSQIQAYVDDVVRSELPTLTVDQAYLCKQEMADNVHSALRDNLTDFGLIVNKVLITDLRPDAKVLAAMNEINTAKRIRAAQQEEAEAHKIARVKDAEAEMESKHLSGVGVAKMRMAITNGCKESIETMTETVGLAPHDVVHMMLVTQYLDTLKDFASDGRSSVMVPSAGRANSTEDQVRQGILTAGMVQPGGVPPPPKR